VIFAACVFCVGTLVGLGLP